MVDGGWGYGRGRDEQGGAGYIAELSITERHTKRRRDGRDEQGGADYIAELSIPKGIRRVDAMAMRLHSSVGPCGFPRGPEHIRN